MEARPSCGVHEQHKRRRLWYVRWARGFHRGDEAVPWVPPWADFLPSSPLLRRMR